MTYIYKTFTANYITEVSSQTKDYLSTVGNPETAKIPMCEQNSGSVRGYVITDPDLTQVPEPLFSNYKWVGTTDSFPSNSDFKPKIAEFTTILNTLPKNEAYTAKTYITNANNEDGFANLYYLTK